MKYKLNKLITGKPDTTHTTGTLLDTLTLQNEPVHIHKCISGRAHYALVQDIYRTDCNLSQIAPLSCIELFIDPLTPIIDSTHLDTVKVRIALYTSDIYKRLNYNMN